MNGCEVGQFLCVCFCCVVGPVTLGAYNRALIRAHYEIPGSPATDCCVHLCCGRWAFDQEKLHLIKHPWKDARRVPTANPPNPQSSMIQPVHSANQPSAPVGPQLAQHISASSGSAAQATAMALARHEPYRAQLARSKPGPGAAAIPTLSSRQPEVTIKLLSDTTPDSGTSSSASAPLCLTSPQQHNTIKLLAKMGFRAGATPSHQASMERCETHSN
eukprot:CAMPEP_0175840072 /NCGR_PEP_ID=MMETSP0107_2-20121207/19163_1 /TAXON_ID=195067 ORGANISM="Goniomonas pacifica, Strain CCMP1869" /NCGR_SAMPLE_ID=MMETSP0107_2 /ASSEMBLY_ACC=CAM_ASM_000203 /LENGTH=216 /DNA_ID=CAMNT_0017153873 /DNA_START=216 /DNA_END=864 /DNA_ORIENTATION=+